MFTWESEVDDTCLDDSWGSIRDDGQSLVY